MSTPEKDIDHLDSRAQQAMDLYAKAAQAGQSYFTEVAMPGCKPNAVNPDEIARSE